MDADSYAEFYDTEYRPFYSGSYANHEVIFEKQRQKGMDIYDYLEDRLSGFHEMDVFEIGTGPGGILSVFNERGHPTRGIDLGSESVAFAQSNGLDVEVGSAADVTIGASPDIVILSHVVEHFLTPVADLKAVRDLCAPDTRVYAELPGVKSLWWTYQSDFLQMLQNAHTYYFTATTLTAILAAAGFETIGCDEYIQGLWMPATPSDQRVESEFDDLTTFLERMEYLRHLPTPARLRQYNILNPKNVAKRVITGKQST